MLLFAAITGVGCAAAMTSTEPTGPHRRLLFVGNSLTYTNDLPATVAAIATANGDTLEVSSATAPNLALIDHLTGGSSAVPQLRNNRWDYVVLQQGPTSAGGICRDSMVLWTRMFDTLVRASGGRTALFMTWPSLSQGDVWAGVRTSYQLSAQAVGGVFLPAGEAWHSALAAHPGLPLYGPDGFHPSAMGSYLAALEIYERLSGRDAQTLTTQAFAEGRAIIMGADTVRWLQQAAHAANGAWPANPNVAAPPPMAGDRTSGGC
jgi:hypothetical protein